MSEETGMYLIADDPFYTAGMVPAAEIITLVSNDGIILATAYRHDSGRYANTPEPGPPTLLYRDWQLCLTEVTVGIDQSKLDATYAEGWA